MSVFTETTLHYPQEFSRRLSNIISQDFISNPLILTLAINMLQANEEELDYEITSLHELFYQYFRYTLREDDSNISLQRETRDTLKNLLGEIRGRYLYKNRSEILQIVALASIEDRDGWGELSNFISQICKLDIDQAAEIARETVLTLVGQWGGIINYEGDNLRFAHLTFRDFFVAMSFVERKSKEQIYEEGLFDRWDDERWEQVILFVLGLLQKQGASISHIVEEIIGDSLQGIMFGGMILQHKIHLPDNLKTLIIREMLSCLVNRDKTDDLIRLDRTPSLSREVLRLIGKLQSQNEIKAILFSLAKEANEFLVYPDIGIEAIWTLGKLEEYNMLRSLMQDSELRIHIRLQAAACLARNGYLEEGVEYLVKISRIDTPLNTRNREMAGKFLKSLGFAEQASEVFLEICLNKLENNESYFREEFDNLLNTDEFDRILQLLRDSRLPLRTKQSGVSRLVKKEQHILSLKKLMFDSKEEINLRAIILCELIEKEQDEELLALIGSIVDAPSLAEELFYELRGWSLTSLSEYDLVKIVLDRTNSDSYIRVALLQLLETSQPNTLAQLGKDKTVPSEHRLQIVQKLIELELYESAFPILMDLIDAPGLGAYDFQYIAWALFEMGGSDEAKKLHLMLLSNPKTLKNSASFLTEQEGLGFVFEKLLNLLRQPKLNGLLRKTAAKWLVEHGIIIEVNQITEALIAHYEIALDQKIEILINSAEYVLGETLINFSQNSDFDNSINITAAKLLSERIYVPPLKSKFNTESIIRKETKRWIQANSDTFFSLAQRKSLDIKSRVKYIQIVYFCKDKRTLVLIKELLGGANIFTRHASEFQTLLEILQDMGEIETLISILENEEYKAAAGLRIFEILDSFSDSEAILQYWLKQVELGKVNEEILFISHRESVERAIRYFEKQGLVRILEKIVRDQSYYPAAGILAIRAIARKKRTDILDDLLNETNLSWEVRLESARLYAISHNDPSPKKFVQNTFLTLDVPYHYREQAARTLGELNDIQFLKRYALGPGHDKQNRVLAAFVWAQLSHDIEAIKLLNRIARGGEDENDNALVFSVARALSRLGESKEIETLFRSLLSQDSLDPNDSNVVIEWLARNDCAYILKPIVKDKKFPITIREKAIESLVVNNDSNDFLLLVARDDLLETSIRVNAIAHLGRLKKHSDEMKPLLVGITENKHNECLIRLQAVEALINIDEGESTLGILREFLKSPNFPFCYIFAAQLLGKMGGEHKKDAIEILLVVLSSSANLFERKIASEGLLRLGFKARLIELIKEGKFEHNSLISLLVGLRDLRFKNDLQMLRNDQSIDNNIRNSVRFVLTTQMKQSDKEEEFIYILSDPLTSPALVVDVLYVIINLEISSDKIAQTLSKLVEKNTLDENVILLAEHVIKKQSIEQEGNK